MSLLNSILTISNNQEDIELVKNTLANLRQKDALIGCSIDQGISFCQKYIPEVVIIFPQNRLTESFELCSAIRKSQNIKNTAIIFVFDQYNEDTLLTSFDKSVTDYLIKPFRATELMIRVIWALKDNSLRQNLESKKELLKAIGVIDKKTNAISAKYFEQALQIEFNNSLNYKQPLTLMTLSTAPHEKDKISSSMLSGLIKKNIRTNDVFCYEKNNTFYLLLPKTASKGGITIYHRIKNDLNEINIYAGISVSENIANYKDLIKLSRESLDKALSLNENIIIANDNTETLLPKETVIKKIKSEEKSDDNWLKQIHANKDTYSDFKKAYTYKIDNVLTPVFKKVLDELSKQEQEGFTFDSKISYTLSFIHLKDDFRDIEASLKFADPGFSKIVIDKVYKKKEKPTSKRTILKIEEFTEQNIQIIIKDFLSNFEQLLQA